MKFGWFSWFVLSVAQQSFVEAPKPLKASVRQRRRNGVVASKFHSLGHEVA